MIKLYLYIIIIPLSMLALESINTNGIFKNNRIPFIKIVFPFTIWVMEGLELNKIFKQSRIVQARMMYLMMAMSISYLVVNFLIDFSECFNFLR